MDSTALKAPVEATIGERKEAEQAVRIMFSNFKQPKPLKRPPMQVDTQKEDDRVKIVDRRDVITNHKK